ncbi:hypothetical protein [Desulfurobacterium indicum]|uniref:HEPN domain-containing protein n=1 Tax=Desulfurobacterium indicum TaxID=1914305 RepID=A0A1R1MJF1_9BACT|nr:hypothetical protein [Desulfurobacterium indicum]OMH39931.1 hypothetical protein BLW93_07855 [Desulfurobacterium indicum]
MKDFEVILNKAIKDEVNIDIARKNLQHAKAWITEAHDRLRNHELHKEADKVYEILERVNNLLRRLS